MKETFIGHYKVIKKMGSGGMARVYLAVHRDIPNLRVVLKVLTDPQLAGRFKQEADKLALLDGHPNICRIRHFFDHGDDLVIAMDYIDGPTVEERINRDGKFTYDEAIEIIAQVLDVLEIAHSRNISHRDIKPSNIMLDAHKRVQVIDFGIAKGEADPSMTAAHGYAGTPDYMAPEQFGHSSETKYELADIYGVGVTLYEMLCGELPFAGGDVFAIRDAKLTAEPKDPRKFRPDMSKHLEHVIRKAISREPKDRFQSPREMKQFLLQGAARDSERKTPPPMPAKGAAKPPKPPRRRKPFPWKGVGIVVLLAAIAGLGYVNWPAIQEWMNRPDTAEPKPAPPVVAADPPALFEPAEQMALEAPEKVTFVWSSQGDGQTYGWEMANDPEFLLGRRNHALLDTAFTTPNELPEGSYFWRIQIDPYGSPPGGYSEVRSFTIGPGEPVEDAPVVATGPGRLAVGVNRPADIYVDGTLRERGSEELAIELEPGDYRIRVVVEDSREGEITRRVTVPPGETVSQRFAFTDIGQGKVLVSSTPDGATIKVDGQTVSGATTPHAMSLREGSYSISAETGTAGDPVLRQTVEVKDGEEVAVAFDFREARLDRQARQLADSLSRAVATLDDAMRGTQAFTMAQRLTTTGHQAYADRDLRTAAKSYEEALAFVEQARLGEDATDDIRALIESLRRAYQAGDIDAIRSFYPKMPGNEQKGWEQFFDSVRDLQVTMEPDDIYIDGGTAESEVAVRMQFSDRQGKKDNQFRWKVRFEQVNGAWIVADHETL